MTHARRLRSVLFMPASNPRVIAKARTLPCDAMVLDLEDAVAPEEKAAARTRVADELAQGGFGSRHVVVRINAFDTPWGRDDATALRRCGADAVLIPKAAAPDDIAALRSVLGDGGPAVWAMIETCAGVLALPEITRAAGLLRLTALLAGTNDLAKDMRCRPGTDRAPLVPALAAIVMGARSAGIVPLDGVCNVIDDADRLAAECAQGVALGFDGKSLIHPSQIDAANAAFRPAPETVAWARGVRAAFADPANDDKGAIRYEGQMIERLHLAEAEAVLAEADQGKSR